MNREHNVSRERVAKQLENLKASMDSQLSKEQRANYEQVLSCLREIVAIQPALGTHAIATIHLEIILAEIDAGAPGT